jgi:transcriptional regulator with XRE-family HTH domain
MKQASGGERTDHIIAFNTRKRRAALSMSQAELARRSRISRPVISAIEQGRANPTLRVLDRLCSALDLRVVDLLARPASRTSATDDHSRAGRRPSFRTWLAHPPIGSKAARARDFGVDLTLLAENVALSPGQRLKKLTAATEAIASIRRSMRARHRS